MLIEKCDSENLLVIEIMRIFAPIKEHSMNTNNDIPSEILFTPQTEQSRGIWLQDTSMSRLWRVEENMRVWFYKSLRTELLGDKRYRQMWRKEYEVGSRITSPYVVRCHRLIETDDELTLVMDYVEGQTLNGQRLTLSQIRQVAIQLLLGLIAIHERGVVHLDLKPSNVMLTDLNGDVRIIDLGGCYTDSYPFSMAMTDGYAAPEIKEPNCQLDARADIYSVGRIMEFLLSHSAEAVNSRVSESLQAIASIATSQERDKRYPSAQAMLYRCKLLLSQRNAVGHGSPSWLLFWFCLAAL